MSSLLPLVTWLKESVTELLLLPWKLFLVTRYDVKQQLTSPWFYVILIGNSLLPPAWYLCYPENAAFKVLLVDELENANFENIRRAIEDEGFPVHVRHQLRPALAELLDWKATAVVHVKTDGQVEWYATTPRLAQLLGKAFQASMLSELNERLDTLARGQGAATLELPLEAELYFQDLERRNVSTSTFMVRVTWYFTSLVTLTMFILQKPTLSKFLRLYSRPMMLTGKMLAGLVLGFTMMGAFLGMAYLLGFRFPNLGPYLVAYSLSILSGVAFGCMLGGIPLVLSRDPLGLVFAGLMCLSLIFMGFAQLSAFLTPISNMDPTVYTLNAFNPLYNLNQVIHNCVYLGDSLGTELARLYLRRVVVEALACFLVTLAVLYRL